ncbi:conserved hypothetical protein [Flavobacterium sp. 9R]|uniref:hypothetical protein n=1 Tax=Flavobacterium sp. 9R TaxID=2653143 RepID=UPI0012F27086|nr:hypothetical protein [Flavobacterium sp. 9R]VXB04641.1 conserved hypothetical protein [Flavobacterium sp. 9R]
MRILLLLLLLMTSGIFLGQSNELETEEKFNKHVFGFMLSHTNISQGIKEGNRKWLSLPSFALDYNFNINSKWQIGLHNDVVIEKFVVSTADEKELERSTPIASAVVLGYKVGKHFTFQAGLGGEFAKEEDFVLTRFGVEYGVEIRNNWELTTNFSYDIKWNAYDSFSLGIGVCKSFGE